MKKNEYVSPGMEIIEMTERCSIMAISGDVDTTLTPGGTPPPNPDDDND